MLEGIYPTTTYYTPVDGAIVLEALVGLLDGARESIRVIIYSLTDPALIDALCHAHARGVDVRLVLDHTQSTGPHEVAQLHRLMMTVPPANLRIGTSPDHRQLIHLKGVAVDGVVVARGSLNWSPAAREQVNDFNIYASEEQAQAFVTLFDAQWQWLSANEPAYQPA